MKTRKEIEKILRKHITATGGVICDDGDWVSAPIDSNNGRRMEGNFERIVDLLYEIEKRAPKKELEALAMSNGNVRRHILRDAVLYHFMIHFPITRK